MKKRHKSRRRGYRVFTRVGSFFGAGLLITGVLFQVDWSYVMGIKERLEEVLHTHPYFSVKEIAISGYQKVGGSEIAALTGLRPGVNIWEVNPTRIEAKLHSHPWVRREMVRREFPQRVIIQIEEWQAKGIVVLDKLYYANAEGLVFKEVEPGEKANLPFITGLGGKDFVLNSNHARRKITEALSLSDLFAESAMAVSEIRFRPEGNIIAYPVSHSVPLHMGWGDWTGKLQRLKRVWGEWKGKEQLLVALDLSFRDQVVVKLSERT